MVRGTLQLSGNREMNMLLNVSQRGDKYWITNLKHLRGQPGPRYVHTDGRYLMRMDGPCCVRTK